MDKEKAKQLPQLVESLGSRATPDYDVEADINPSKHKINDIVLRPKKKVVKPVIGKDGKPEKHANGDIKTTTKRVDPSRIALPLQQIIVTRRVAFMNLGKVKLFSEPKDENQEKALALLQLLRENNKLAFKETEFAKTLNEELQVAKLWYSVATKDASHWGGLSPAKVDFRMQILSPSRGDTLLPVFDNKGKMTYFGRGYEILEGSDDLFTLIGDGSTDVKKVQCLDIYSDEFIYRFKKGGDSGGDWVFAANPEANTYGKIPVIYQGKKNPIWAVVQVVIERIETALSDLADANSYNASPLLAFLNVKGAQAQEKGEQGKAVEITGDKADVKYVTWDQVINAVEFEINTLVNFVFSLTQTPNISFEEMKNLGTLSGVAFDRVFIDAHLAAQADVEGGYGESIQRDINLQKVLISSSYPAIKPAMQSLSVTFEVPRFKLEDLDADVDLAIKAKSGGLVSGETAMGISGLVTNVQDEIKRIIKEKKEEVKQVAE